MFFPSFDRDKRFMQFVFLRNFTIVLLLRKRQMGKNIYFFVGFLLVP